MGLSIAAPSSSAKNTSRGARLCLLYIRRSRASRGGLRYVGRARLAKLLGCSKRTVTRYVSELKAAGLVEAVRPKLSFTAGVGWRSITTAAYRVTDPKRPVRPQKPRSSRVDTGVPSPLLRRGRVSAHGGPDPVESPVVDAVRLSEHVSVARAAIRAARAQMREPRRLAPVGAH